MMKTLLLITLLLMVPAVDAMTVIEYTGANPPDRYGRAQCNVDVLVYDDYIVIMDDFSDMMAMIREKVGG